MEDLGHWLKVPMEMLDTIEETSRGDLSRCKTEVLHYWVKNDTTASWKTLADAIENMGGYMSLVQSIRENCCGEGIYILLGNKNSLPVYIHSIISYIIYMCTYMYYKECQIYM